MIPPGEKIVETKKCRLSGREFFVTDQDLVFYNKVSPIFGGKKYEIPSPTLCPEERMRLHCEFRSDMHLYKDICDYSKKDILSAYSGIRNFPVFERDIWWSDCWNPLIYASEFDFTRNFFSQFLDLQDKVPRMSVNTGLGNENCPFVNNASENKNCYLTFGINFSENCYYGWRIFRSKNCLDSLNI